MNRIDNFDHSRVGHNIELLKKYHNRYPFQIPIITTPYTHFPINTWNVGNEFNSTYIIQDREAGWIPGKFAKRTNCQNFLFSHGLGYCCK